ncbi:unnamed protein product [Owenia fusiformis]|uniref:Pre-mRNA-splicing factor SPF27 n=1 Tax=Owenia fusiformis TaxID=6347 RepID=A0A8S4N3J8_OWEFU|nr:unnamed protein product [Owenia fusiformis]
MNLYFHIRIEAHLDIKIGSSMNSGIFPPLVMIQCSRYELPQPPGGKMTDISAWTECVENSQAQLEHQALRIQNLELMSKYGASMWKSHNDILVGMSEDAQKQLNKIRKDIQDVNWQRKNEQTKAGGKLRQLEESWVGLVSKNYEIERACVELEKEIQEEKRQKSYR